MGKHLTEAEIDRFHENGVVFPIDILSADEAADCRARLEVIEARHGAMNYAIKPYLTVTLADELAHDARILDAVEDIIGPDILLWDGTFIIKEPHDDRFVSWHQDLTYWGIGPPEGVVAIWLALSPVMPENGCMRAVPGSHRAGILPHRDTFGEHNLLSRGQTLAVEFDEDAAVDIVLAPGQMSLHHGQVIHGSNPNASGQRRIGLTLQFVAPSVRQTVIDDDSAMLMRGKDDHGHFALEPRPLIDFAPESIAFAARIATRKHKVLFRGADADEMKRYSATS